MAIIKDKIKRAALKTAEEVRSPKDLKTALVLSGGASRGAYQMGVWQALREMGIHLDLVCGASIGAMNAAFIAQGAWEEAYGLWTSLETDEVFDFKHAIENLGGSFDGIKAILEEKLSEEKIRSSDTELGVVTVSVPGKKAVYKYTDDFPEGKMLDYILASCTILPVVSPYEIDGTKYIDGGYRDYIPLRLALDRNCDRIIAVNLDAPGTVREEDLAEAGDRLTMISSSWDLGSIIVFDPEHAKHILRLGYLDTLKAFGAFDGKKYSFIKGQVDLRSLGAAEHAATVFELDPLRIYTKDSFEEDLASEIQKALRGQDEDLEKIESALSRVWMTIFKPKEIAESFEAFKYVSKKTKLIALASYIKKQGYAYPDGTPEEEKKKPRFPMSKAMQKLLGSDLPAAVWLVKHNFL